MTPCDAHWAYRNDCLMCKVASFGCEYAGLRHEWRPESNYCQQQYCSYPKPSWVICLEIIGWPLEATK